MVGAVDEEQARVLLFHFSIEWGGTPVGQIMLHDIDRQAHEALVGYHLFEPRFRGQGDGTRTLALLQRFIQEETDLERVVIITSDDNLASQRIAQKCGFVYTGAPREDPVHGVVCQWVVPSRLPEGTGVSAKDLERLTRLEIERERRFKVLDDIRARNADKDADEVERDVAEEIAAMRQG
ncbi:MAG: GNAT family N-acetyltransferase [Chloroflexota bacterium]